MAPSGVSYTITFEEGLQNFIDANIEHATLQQWTPSFWQQAGQALEQAIKPANIMRQAAQYAWMGLPWLRRGMRACRVILRHSTLKAITLFSMYLVKDIRHSEHLKRLREVLVLVWNGIISLNRVRLLSLDLHLRTYTIRGISLGGD